jgi:hypothetical protein
MLLAAEIERERKAGVKSMLGDAGRWRKES